MGSFGKPRAPQLDSEKKPYRPTLGSFVRFRPAAAAHAQAIQIDFGFVRQILLGGRCARESHTD